MSLVSCAACGLISPAGIDRLIQIGDLQKTSLLMTWIATSRAGAKVMATISGQEKELAVNMEENHRQVMTDLAREQGWQRGIELGLGSGKLFARMLAIGIRMIGVDLGIREDRRSGIEAICRVDPNVEKVYWMATHEAAPLVPDAWADFVFIDAAHGYHAVRQDIIDWLPKVKPGGWFGGHDYHRAFPGVIRAVDEAFGRDGVELIDGHIWVMKAS